MSVITVQELRSWPGKPRRFSIEELSINADTENRNANVFDLRVGQLLHLDELAGFRVSGVNILIKR